MLGDMKPFRLAGNIYYVGTYKESSHLIDTGDGLILIDVGNESNALVVNESIEALGFRVEDVKYILLSHGHYDHSWGTPLITDKCSAKVFLAKEDVRYLNGKFTPDEYYEDGGTIKLGNTEILTIATPGHTLGTYSFFFYTEVDGVKMRAGMFGGAGVKQMGKAYLDKQGGLYYHQRGDFFRSLKKLAKEKVDIFLGNHSWNNKTREKYEASLVSDVNPFINTNDEWQRFLKGTELQCLDMIKRESRELFVNYAHRGASEYAPENTALSFSHGIFLGANGIETDVQLTSDGVAVLFHDNDLERMTGEVGSVRDHTYEELSSFKVKKGELFDRIMKLEDFFYEFGWRDVTLAIELKADGTETVVADLIQRFDLEKKCVVTSFSIDRLSKIHAYQPNLKLGYLTARCDDELMSELIRTGIDEFCPNAASITPELVEKWHKEGFRVRAWGVANEELMRTVYDSGADGMTVNFPDKLKEYIEGTAPAGI